jgi:phosphorylcholine metabolism protein LicD
MLVTGIMIIIFIIIFLIVLLVMYRVSFKQEQFYSPAHNEKFFKELESNPHLDARYGIKNITADEIQNTLRKLLKHFSEHCEKIGIQPILMYGTLIGHYFNKKMLPWDDDIDLILLEDSVSKLKNVDHDEFIIEINPNSADRSIKDTPNVIDARVISKTNGVFIDITFLYGEDILKAKDQNIYSEDDILPLKKDVFEESGFYVPNNVKKCLVQRYGEKVLLPSFNNWIFSEESNEWIKR